MHTINNEPICKCIGCPQALNVYVQFGRLTGECKNPQCRRVHVTMDIETLQSLSNADLDQMKYPDYSIPADR
jgi:hypothetical protein